VSLGGRGAGSRQRCSSCSFSSATDEAAELLWRSRKYSNPGNVVCEAARCGELGAVEDVFASGALVVESCTECDGEEELPV
jgi:hypothetical protein